VKRGVLIALVSIGALAVLAWLLALIFTKPFLIPSASMEPTLEIDDRILVRKTGGYSPERGDIVVVNPPPGAETLDCGVQGFEPVAKRQACPRPTEGEAPVTFVERIVAVGGDRLRIEQGATVINDKRQDEPYARTGEPCELCDLPREITVPDGHVFLMGDNRAGSADSREWGPIPEDSIVGPALVRYWPPSRWGTP
jgi:signal peptidase I